jgi:DNA-directed RNA polymerase subunit M/transcription elongation factor TFIIS
MSSPPAPSSSVACPACGQKLAVRAEDRGRKGKCSRCGEVFRIELGETDEREQASPRTDDRWEATAPTTVTFSCELCETRLTASVADVGRSVKCPDCGRRNIIPPPAPRQAPKTPAAMSGAQYGLWGVDNAPLPDELAAKAPKLHPVECQLCQTLMYATDAQLGKKLKCPDCGSMTVAHARAPEKPKGPAVVPDGEEYQLDETAPPPERPAAEVFSLNIEPTEGQNLSQIPAVATALAARKQEVIAPPAPRPALPKWPLVSGVWRMLVTQEIIARWIMLSLMLGFVGQLMGEAVLTPIQGQAEAIKIIFAAVGAVAGGVWISMMAPLLVAIVAESADGNDQVYQPPQWLAFDWFAELFSMLMAAAIAGLAGMGAWQLAAIAAAPTPAQWGAPAIAVALVFPFALLSTMLEGTPVAVLSPRLLGSFGRCMGSWLLFYTQTFSLLALVGLIAWTLGGSSPSPSGEPSPALIWGLPFVMLAALISDMRLLGRLAWAIQSSYRDDSAN